MDWSRSLDLYCERTDGSLWSEPLNFLTNGAFLLAAILALRHASHISWSQRKPVVVLGVMLGAIGIGSGLFHSFASQWAQLMDVLPIGIYIGTTLFLWLRDAHGFTFAQRLQVLGVLLFMSLAFVVSIPSAWVNGSQGYFGVILVMGWLALKQKETPVGGREFLMATFLFGASLGFRALDLWVCPIWPLGTHFLWHLCNAAVCYMPLKAYTRVRAKVA